MQNNQNVKKMMNSIQQKEENVNKPFVKKHNRNKQKNTEPD